MRYIRLGIYILLFFVVLFPFLVLPRILRIGNIECYSQYGICSDNLASKIDIGLGRTLYNAKKTISENFKRDSSIEKYSFQLKLPNILRIDLVLIKPKYAVTRKNSNEAVLIDSSGDVLGKVTETNLPGILVSTDLPQVGTKIDLNLHFALDLMYGMYYLYQVKAGEIVEDTLVVPVQNGINMIFPLEGDKDILLGSAKLVLSRLNQGQDVSKIGRVKEIDLRYKNPVLKYE